MQTIVGTKEEARLMGRRASENQQAKRTVRFRLLSGAVGLVHGEEDGVEGVLGLDGGGADGARACRGEVRALGEDVVLVVAGKRGGGPIDVAVVVEHVLAVL